MLRKYLRQSLFIILLFSVILLAFIFIFEGHRRLDKISAEVEGKAAAFAEVIYQFTQNSDYYGLERLLYSLNSEYVPATSLAIQTNQPAVLNAGIFPVVTPGRYFEKTVDIVYNGEKIAELKYAISRARLYFAIFHENFIYLLLVFCFIITMFGITIVPMLGYNLRLVHLTTFFQHYTGKEQELKELHRRLLPIRTTSLGKLCEQFMLLLSREQSLREKVAQMVRDATVGKIAQQVAHDIRSPLTALKVVSGHLAELSEEKRVMIRNAVQRIEDIAHDLAEKKPQPAISTEGVSAPTSEVPSIQLLSSLIEPLISEKRIQFRSRLGIQIHTTLDAAAYGLFARVQPVEFKRILSNLINNAVEAMGDTGEVRVTLCQQDAEICITVTDNGQGIAPETLPQLMQRGATFGKTHGSGLGLYHARTTMEAWGGTLALRSVLGEGTTITLTLPAADPPAWFVPALLLTPHTTIIVLDDDASIHQLWEERFAGLPLAAHNIAVRHFSSGTEVVQWQAQQRNIDALWLCDYELLGESQNGLDLIEQLDLQGHAMLVTSRYEDQGVQARCATLRVRLIPKGLAGYVPIQVVETVSEMGAPPVVVRHDHVSTVAPQTNGVGYRVLVLDDDDGIRLAWKMERARLGIDALTTFPSMEACELAQPDYSLFDLAFVDKQIPESQWRIDHVIAHLKQSGVQKVIVATGEAVQAVAHDPLCAAADGIATTKIPETLTPYHGGPDAT